MVKAPRLLTTVLNTLLVSVKSTPMDPGTQHSLAVCDQLSFVCSLEPFIASVNVELLSLIISDYRLKKLNKTEQEIFQIFFEHTKPKSCPNHCQTRSCPPQ